MSLTPGPFQIKLPDNYPNPLFDDFSDDRFSLYHFEAALCSSKYAEYPLVLRGFLRRCFSYNDIGSMPPFTIRQLIAMVLVSHPCDVALHFQDCIVRIIFYAFRFYHGSKDEVDTARKQRELILSVSKELELVDSPFTGRMVWDEPAGHPRTMIGIQHDLKDHTMHGTVPEKKFDFLRLPPELRLRVYEFTLSFETLLLHRAHWSRYPNSGPCFCPDDGRHAFDTSVNGREIACADPNKLLALLSVNRQINQEAVPVFYSGNEFEFHDMTEMHTFLRSIGPFRRKLIRNVATVYGRRGDWSKDAKIAKATFKLLSEARPLRSFKLFFIEDHVFGNLRNPKITKPEHVPGLSFLRDTFRSIPNLAFFLCPLVEEYLKDTMGKPEGDINQATEHEVPVLTSKRSLRPKKSIQYKEVDKVD